jgi:hypothetical protein
MDILLQKLKNINIIYKMWWFNCFSRHKTISPEESAIIRKKRFELIYKFQNNNIHNREQNQS